MAREPWLRIQFPKILVKTNTCLEDRAMNVTAQATIAAKTIVVKVQTSLRLTVVNHTSNNNTSNRHPTDRVLEMDPLKIAAKAPTT